jgi:hypothetical protein
MFFTKTKPKLLSAPLTYLSVQITKKSFNVIGNRGTAIGNLYIVTLAIVSGNLVTVIETLDIATVTRDIVTLDIVSENRGIASENRIVIVTLAIVSENRIATVTLAIVSENRIATVTRDIVTLDIVSGNRNIVSKLKTIGTRNAVLE